MKLCEILTFFLLKDNKLMRVLSMYVIHWIFFSWSIADTVRAMHSVSLLFKVHFFSDMGRKMIKYKA